MKNKTFLSWLEEIFISTNVWGETPITKENCEELFEDFVNHLSKEKVIEYADLFGRWKHNDGQSKMLKERLSKL